MYVEVAKIQLKNGMSRKIVFIFILVAKMQPNHYLCSMKIIFSILLMLSPFFIKAQTTNDVVLNSAKEQIGKKVWSGKCFDLIDYSLMCADISWKERSNRRYIYGKNIKHSDIIPGDIVLYKGCKFKSGRTVSSHIAIIYSVNNNKDNVELIEQNTKRNLRKSIVIINRRNICESDLIKGKIEFYRPLSE